MMDELYSEFVLKLTKLYGTFDDGSKRFEKASNSKISRDLGYSDAQFSRLINQSATTGEYNRAIQNVDRILRVQQLEKNLKSDRGPQDWKSSKFWVISSVVLFCVLIAVLILWRYVENDGDRNMVTNDRDDMLRWTFETSFINPYTKLNDLPEDCNYPCYKYQGKWKLKEGYKIPFFRERSGFHYAAVEVNMYARCMSEKSDSGNLLEGYEYQKHEIWYDKRELPIDSFLNDDSSLKEFYQKTDFETDENFVKVAIVHTFFRNEFDLDSNMVHRIGKVIGRDLEFVPDDDLKDLLSASIKDDIEGELNMIASNRLEDFSRPIACTDAIAPNPNFNLVKEGDSMSFDCQLTTSRFSINYRKTFELQEQYIKNICH